MLICPFPEAEAILLESLKHAQLPARQILTNAPERAGLAAALHFQEQAVLPCLVMSLLCRRVLGHISKTPQAAAAQAPGRIARGGRARAAPARPQAQAAEFSAAAGQQRQPCRC